MGLGADQLEALAECVDLINSGRQVAGGPAGAGGVGALTSLSQVVAFARQHRVENVSAARASDVERLRQLRDRLDSIAGACESGNESAAIKGLNALLAETGAVPQIVAHDGRGPHIHVSWREAALADRIAAHCAMGLAELVVSGATDRVRSCAAPRCDAVFIDLSRNRTRRYCDAATCGNRLHVAAYRSRQAALGAA